MCVPDGRARGEASDVWNSTVLCILISFTLELVSGERVKTNDIRHICIETFPNKIAFLDKTYYCGSTDGARAETRPSILCASSRFDVVYIRTHDRDIPHLLYRAKGFIRVYKKNKREEKIKKNKRARTHALSLSLCYEFVPLQQSYGWCYNNPFPHWTPFNLAFINSRGHSTSTRALRNRPRQLVKPYSA